MRMSSASKALSYVDLGHIEDGNALLELQRRPPEQLAEPLVRRLDHDESVLFSFPVDMNLLGDYVQEWLVLTDRRCMTWTQRDESFELREEFHLDDLKQARLRTLTGNHILLVDFGQGWQELLRSSNLTAWKLRPTRQVLEAVAEDGRQIIGKMEEFDLTLPDREVCESCGRIIRPRIGTCLACLNKRQLIGRMLKLVVPYKKAFAAVVALLVIGVVTGLITPLLGRSFINLFFVPQLMGVEEAPADSFWYTFGEAGSRNLFIAIAAVWFVVMLMPTVLNAIRMYVSSWIGNHIIVDLSNELFSHMMRLSLSYYHREETGRVMARITRDVQRMRRFISGQLPMIVENLLTVVVILTIMFSLHAKLTVLSMAPIPILVILAEVARRKVHRVYHILWRRSAAVSRYLASTIPGIRVVKGFAQGERERGRFGGIINRVFEGRMHAVKIRAVLQPLLHSTVRIGNLLIYVVAAYMVYRDGEASGIDIGMIGAFTAYVWRFYTPLRSLVRTLPEFERAATSADRVFEVLDNQPELDTGRRETEMPRIHGTVEFQHVSFGYDPDELVLKDVNFQVEPGEMIGLVGHSGAGKTTLINLVCHFFKPDEGRVLIDGHDLTKVKVNSLRSQIGIVSQEPFLFNGTVAENIAYGRPDATELEVLAAARAANAHDFIVDMPEAYDTVVGERGARVSGGERQRIAIARAILKNPRILILDEATSSVDTETEEKIQEALRRLVAGRTTFAIAHRLSTLKFADRLFVLKDGELVETGTHEELVAMDGVYATLCEKQKKLASMTAWQE